MITTYATREEWEAARLGVPCIGASDVPAILGISPWSGPWDVWRRLTTGERPARSDADRATLERGLRWEETVHREYVAARPDLIVLHLGASAHVIARHPSLPWAVCSPDARVTDPTEPEPVGLAEYKTAARADGWAAESLDTTDIEQAVASVPPYYVAQVAWQMHVTGARWVDVVVLLPWYDVRVIRVRWAQELAELCAQVEDWHARHVVGDVEPDAASSAEAVRRASARQPAPAKAALSEADADTAALLLTFAEANTARKAAEAAEDTAKAALLARVEDGTAGWRSGGVSARVSRSSRTTLDSKALLSAHPDIDPTPYQRVSESISLRLTVKE